MSRTLDEEVSDSSDFDDASDLNEPSDLSEVGDAEVTSEDDEQTQQQATSQPADAEDWTAQTPDADEPLNGQPLLVAEGAAAATTSSAAAQPPLPVAQQSGRLMHALRPHGHWNQRAVLVSVVAVVAVVLYLVSGNSSDPFKPKQGGAKGQAARDLFGPGASEEVKPLKTSAQAGGALTTPELGSPGQAVNFSGGNQSGATTTTATTGMTPGVMGTVVPATRIPPVTFAAAPTAPSVLTLPSATTVSAQAVADRLNAGALSVNSSVPPNRENSFAVRLRAGERAADQAVLKDVQQTEERSARAETIASMGEAGAIGSNRAPLSAATISSLPRGLRLQLALLEPVRSGIATSVSARVVTDARDARGLIVVPAGSTAVVPFLPQEVNGRVVNDRAGEAFVILPNNTQLTLKGTVKGADGYAGLTGRVRKVGGRSALRRIGSAVARAGGNMVGSQTGISAYEVEDAIGVNGMATAPSERVVEIPSGTHFSFTVGL